jgi:16S rRNA (adenine1518-N6/adenine1519-N6)-dimethyltransferase
MSGFKTKKSLGQHFLRSTKTLTAMIDAAQISEGDVVVEIGPGEGVLTQKLLDAGAHVITIEADDRLIPKLKETFNTQIIKGTLTLLHQDVRSIAYAEITKDEYKVVANIPYYITGEIIQQFLTCTHKPTSLTLLVQKEVAQRIVTRDGKESVLSISVKAFGNPKYVQTVKRSLFSPAPKVDSAVIHVGDISEERLGGSTEKEFFRVVKQGFAHKRKKVRKNLEGLVSKEVSEACGIDENARAEELGVEEWVCLVQRS